MLRKILRLVTPGIVILALMSLPVSADVIHFEVPLSGDNQVPPATTSGTGLLIADYDTETRRLTWTVTYEGMTGAPTAAHFHGPAELGVNAGVLVGLEPPLTSPIMGEAVLTPEIAADLMAGLIYLNVHTQAFPGGEIRGQLVPPAG